MTQFVSKVLLNANQLEIAYSLYSFSAFAARHCWLSIMFLGCPSRTLVRSDLVTMISHERLEQF